jgi:hypothetical protein
MSHLVRVPPLKDVTTRDLDRVGRESLVGDLDQGSVAAGAGDAAISVPTAIAEITAIDRMIMTFPSAGLGADRDQSLTADPSWERAEASEHGGHAEDEVPFLILQVFPRQVVLLGHAEHPTARPRAYP